MTKCFFSLLTALVLLCLTASALADPLADQAVAMGADMRRLAASPDYVAALGAPTEIFDLCIELGQGDTTPSCVLCYTLDRPQAVRMLRKESGGLPDPELYALLTRRHTGAAATLNGQSAGTFGLAAAVSLTYRKAVAAQDVTDYCLYVLEYASGSTIFVTVVPGDGAVSLCGDFVLDPDWEAHLCEILPYRLAYLDVDSY